MREIQLFNQQENTINQEAWEEWVEFRTKEKRKKIGPMAERKQQKMLLEYSHAEQQAIIDESIMNSWQGLFRPKNFGWPAPRQVDYSSMAENAVNLYDYI